MFDAIRGRILGDDAMEKEPAGIAGMIVLVKAHPSLQTRLVDFLEGLSTERLGAWAIGGWGGAIRDADAKIRLDTLISTWAASGKNPVLKAAASATRRVGRGGH